jgi:hypothetical protein
MRSARCLLASRVPGERFAGLVAHRESCLRCQAAAARDRSLRKALAGLAGDLVPAPAGLHPAVMARLGRQDAADPRRDLAARAAARYTAAAGLAAAAAVALAAGLARRHSRALG